ncbi:transposase domain-containing protein, partial [Escherichia coli]
FMFFGSDHGGERGALLYGLIGTCRLNGIDPEAYLRHILSVHPTSTPRALHHACLIIPASDPGAR